MADKLILRRAEGYCGEWKRHGNNDGVGKQADDNDIALTAAPQMNVHGRLPSAGLRRNRHAIGRIVLVTGDAGCAVMLVCDRHRGNWLTIPRKAGRDPVENEGKCHQPDSQSIHMNYSICILLYGPAKFLDAIKCRLGRPTLI